MSFFGGVYRIVKKIPKGRVTTYGEIALRLRSGQARKITPRMVGPRITLTSRQRLPASRSQRASMRGKWAISPQLIGFALHANRDPKVPCHRVVNKDGRLAPNFAFGGAEEQRRRLLAEGITFKNENHVDLSTHFWKPRRV